MPRHTNATTKETLKTIVKLWPTMTSDQIAAEVGQSNGNVQTLVRKLRGAGIKLPKKQYTGYLSTLIAGFSEKEGASK